MTMTAAVRVVAPHKGRKESAIALHFVKAKQRREIEAEIHHLDQGEQSSRDRPRRGIGTSSSGCIVGAGGGGS